MLRAYVRAARQASGFIVTTDWTTGEEGGGYQPLAAYGPVSGGYCRERRFQPEVTNAEILNSAGAAVHLVRRAPGFRWIAMVHDGAQARSLTFWSSLEALEHFDAEYRPRVMAEMERQLLHDPWNQRIESMRVGAVLLEVSSPTLPLPGNDIAVWDPPGAFLIDDIVGSPDGAALADVVRTRATAELDRLVSFPGFQLLMIVAHEQGGCSLYLGCGSPSTAAGLAATSEILELRAQIERLASAAGGRVERHNGELVAWYMRDLSG